MNIRPYFTFNGECGEAIELYKRAFKTDVIQVLRFCDMPPVPGFQIPEEYKQRVVQATIKMGDDFMRMSDCGPGQNLNAPESERLSIAVETSVDEIKHIFSVVAEEGRVAMPLSETFYSPCAGVVFDKFGVMWNLVAQKN